jgi:hypothetical protein
MNENAKMISDETVAAIGREGIMDSSGGGEFKCDIFDTL